MRFSLAGYSSIGKRNKNEDAFTVAADDRRLLAVVADGLGGMGNGEYASQQTLDTLRTALLGKKVSPAAFRAAVTQANNDVLALHSKHPSAMTTVAAVWAGDEGAWAMHIGDSRIYHIRAGQIIYQSGDHSLPQEAVDFGEIRPEEIRFHPDRNKLTRALGDAEIPSADEHALSLLPGDRLLLCSDGFWEKIWEAEMLKAAGNTAAAEEWLDEMRRIAEPAAVDNNTAVAIIIL